MADPMVMVRETLDGPRVLVESVVDPETKVALFLTPAEAWTLRQQLYDALVIFAEAVEPGKLTAEDFERGFAARSGITVEELRAFRTVRPCSCGDESCRGWQSLPFEAAAEHDQRSSGSSSSSEAAEPEDLADATWDDSFGPSPTHPRPWRSISDQANLPESLGDVWWIEWAILDSDDRIIAVGPWIGRPGDYILDEARRSAADVDLIMRATAVSLKDNSEPPMTEEWQMALGGDRLEITFATRGQRRRWACGRAILDDPPALSALLLAEMERLDRLADQAANAGPGGSQTARDGS